MANMRVSTEHLHKYWKNYFFQPLLGGLIIALLFTGSELLVPNLVVASFGATTFVIITVPQTQWADPSHLLGGYVCGLVSGILGYYWIRFCPGFPVNLVYGLVVALTIVSEVGLSLEHPPSGALALGVASSSEPLVSSLIALGGIMVIVMVFFLFRRRLINLYIPRL